MVCASTRSFAVLKAIGEEYVLVGSDVVGVEDGYVLYESVLLECWGCEETVDVVFFVWFFCYRETITSVLFLLFSPLLL